MLTALDILLDAITGLVAFIFGLYLLMFGDQLLGVACLILSYVIEMTAVPKARRFKAKIARMQAEREGR